jgi:glycosyltransferase involved in cell wall biosynthesis
MDNAVTISICIPTFSRINFLKRLLDSISIQSFKDFEVIVTDDSPGTQVEQLTAQYKDKFNLLYFKNSLPLGTPANWNEAISHAGGEWIKLMHDDDWFSSSESLRIFADHLNENCKFIFSGYSRVYDNVKCPAQKMVWDSSYNKKIIDEPAILFANNLIGPPSVTLVHKSVHQQYDERLKWRVDIDFYMRLLKQEKKYTYIKSSLINIGMSESQVTRSSINDPRVELPEGWLLIKKYGVKILRNVWVYDAWWRLFRNMDISTARQLHNYIAETWPNVILRMIDDIARTPKALLKWGVTSKLCMALSYLKNYSTIKK